MQFINKTYSLFVLLLSCSLITGCNKTIPAQRSINLTLQKQTLPLKKNNYLVKINNLTDDRSYKDNIGLFCGSEIIVNDLLGWIKNSFLALENDPTLSNNNKILLDISIKKLYVKNIPTSKAAIIVLQVDYVKNNNLSLSKIYRQQFTNVNWNCSNDEIVTLLNHVLKNIIYDISNDLMVLM
jgi:uncharacterized lipoprotein YajG